MESTTLQISDSSILCLKHSSALTIGKSEGDVDGKSYLVSNENRKQDAYFVLKGKDGSYIAKYSVGKNSYEDSPFERQDNKKLGLKIVSNYRISDDDYSEVKVHIVNLSDCDLYVTTVGDDPDEPRVDIVEKDGNVIVL